MTCVWGWQGPLLHCQMPFLWMAETMSQVLAIPAEPCISPSPHPPKALRFLVTSTVCQAGYLNAAEFSPSSFKGREFISAFDCNFFFSTSPDPFLGNSSSRLLGPFCEPRLTCPKRFIWIHLRNPHTYEGEASYLSLFYRLANWGERKTNRPTTAQLGRIRAQI